MRMLGNRAALFGLVLLAFGGGFFKAAQRPVPAFFQVPEQHDNAPEHRDNVYETPYFESHFASSRLHTQTHAASLVELKDGRIRAFWFSGSHEGAPDVEIRSAVFDPVRGQWGPEEVIVRREASEHLLLRHIGKLGNPVAGRAADGVLSLFCVTVSLGGWAGSSITVMSSTDEGASWGAPRRLITSPFFNISTLVKGAPFLYADGTMGLPVYHEFIGKFGELLRFDQAGTVVDKQRLAPGDSGTLQPVVLVKDPRSARVLMRYAGPPPRRVVGTGTQDAGQHWSSPEKSTLLNPNAAITAVRLPNGRILAVLNNVEQGRDVLSLMISADDGASWKPVYQLEDQRNATLDEASYLQTAAALLKGSDAQVAAAPVAKSREYLDSVRQQGCTPQGCRYEFSYPYLIRARNGEFHLVYTWNRSFVKHVQFNEAWLDEQVERAK